MELQEMPVERVRLGAAFLDEVESGWDSRISLSLLDIGSSNCCIMGQLHGSYVAGCRHYEMVRGQMFDRVALGFTLVDRQSGADWRPLTDAWKQEIRRRRAVVAPAPVVVEEEPAVWVDVTCDEEELMLV